MSYLFNFARTTIQIEWDRQKKFLWKCNLNLSVGTHEITSVTTNQLGPKVFPEDFVILICSRISFTLWNLKNHYRVHNSPALNSTLCCLIQPAPRDIYMSLTYLYILAYFLITPKTNKVLFNCARICHMLHVPPILSFWFWPCERVLWR